MRDKVALVRKSRGELFKLLVDPLDDQSGIGLGESLLVIRRHQFLVDLLTDAEPNIRVGVQFKWKIIEPDHATGFLFAMASIAMRLEQHGYFFGRVVIGGFTGILQGGCD